MIGLFVTRNVKFDEDLLYAPEAEEVHGHALPELRNTVALLEQEFQEAQDAGRVLDMLDQWDDYSSLNQGIVAGETGDLVKGREPSRELESSGVKLLEASPLASTSSQLSPFEDLPTLRQSSEVGEASSCGERAGKESENRDSTIMTNTRISSKSSDQAQPGSENSKMLLSSSGEHRLPGSNTSSLEELRTQIKRDNFKADPLNEELLRKTTPQVVITQRMFKHFQDAKPNLNKVQKRKSARLKGSQSVVSHLKMRDNQLINFHTTFGLEEAEDKEFSFVHATISGSMLREHPYTPSNASKLPHIHRTKLPVKPNRWKKS